MAPWSGAEIWKATAPHMQRPVNATSSVMEGMMSGNIVAMTGGSPALELVGLHKAFVMPLVEPLCDTVAVMARGRVVAEGLLDEVRGANTLEETFVELVGVDVGVGEGLSWLAS